MKFALEFDNVTKEYRSFFGRRFRALDGFSLEVYPTEIFGFLGPNGAGKTTAIHLAMGFMRTTSGSGRLLGEPFGHAITRRRGASGGTVVLSLGRPAVSATQHTLPTVPHLFF